MDDHRPTEQGCNFMSFPASCRIHPTAIVSAEVTLGEGVEIGPHAVLEGKITLGDGCVLRAGAYILGNVTMGRGNVVHTGAVLGEAPRSEERRVGKECRSGW